MYKVKKTVRGLLCLGVTFFCAAHDISEKPIVVVVCSYNNHEWSKNTLDSIFSQNYSNFRLIIVDDCSSDGNQQVVQDYIDTYNLADKVTFIKNDVRRRKLFNLYRVLYECEDDEIVVMVDGDDSLAHPNVFSLLNETYEKDDVWFTYGQYKNVPASQALLWGHKEMGYCRAVPKHIVRKQAYRYYSFVYMHLRSFRGWLFKLIKLEDLIADTIPGFEGDFYPASNDVAMYFPMVEMAHMHIRFIPDILYIRNLYSEIVGFKVDRKIQVASAREIRKKPCYPVLFKPKKDRLAPFKNAKSDMFILCKYGLTDIGLALENAYKNMVGLETLHVFFADTPENKTYCRKMKQQYPEVIFVPYALTGSKTLKARLFDCLSCSKTDHFIMTTDSFEIEKPIVLSDTIVALERTYAYRFYLNRSGMQMSGKFVYIGDGICAWKFGSSTYGWRGVNSVDDMILCRKADFMRDFRDVRFNNVYGLVNVIHQIDASETKLGLFFNDPNVHASF